MPSAEDMRQIDDHEQRVRALEFANFQRASSTYRKLSAASTNSDSIFVGAVTLTGYFLSNGNTTSFRYVKLYDLDTNPVVGTDVPKITIGIPPGTGANLSYDDPIAFADGLAIAMTTGAADSSTGAVALNEVIANIFYV